MDRRQNLHSEFIDILGTDKSDSHVYFQPPASVKMKYPCIRYKLSGIHMLNANDKNYRGINEYSVTVIDPDPDSTIHIEILNRFQMCRLNQSYTADNLNHKDLTLYY